MIMEKENLWVLKVGKKGEIYLKKPVQKYLGVKPGDEVIAVGKDELLLIAKKIEALDLLDETPIAEITVEEIKALRKELSEKLITR